MFLVVVTLDGIDDQSLILVLKLEIVECLLCPLEILGSSRFQLPEHVDDVVSLICLLVFHKTPQITSLFATILDG